MARPTGWDILGLDGDPTPGVVESVQALAKEFGDFAHDVESAYRSLNSFGSDTAALQWVGQTAEAFKSNYGPLPGRLQKLYTSYSEASDALSAYAPKLQAAQTKADAALRQAQDAHVDLQRATTNANNAAADLKTAQQNHAANPNPQTVTDAQTAHDTAQTNLNNAKARMAELTKQANDAYNDRIAAAKACASALHHAQSDGIHNKHWWEHIGADLAEWGGKIAEIANDLAPFLDVLALATSWIPGVDVITAGLAEADNLIALAGTGMEIVGDGMQGHWGDALMGAGMLGATFLGGKAISAIGGKAFGALAGKFGKEAEEGAADTVGAEARTAEGSETSTCLTDPVDVVSGWMLTDETDLALPGVLPVVLRRAYASGYGTGRLFGPGWSSTLDQRLSINQAGIHFAGDDTQRLDYAIPVGDEETLPARGNRWPLIWDHAADEIRITDPHSGHTRHFDTVHYRDEIGQIRDLTAISDRNGNRIRILRDEHGTPIRIEHPGYRIAIETVMTVTGPRVSAIRLLDGSEQGVVVKGYRYDERGRLTGVVNSSGKPYIYEYNDSDRINAWIDRTGYRYTYEYDSLGRVIRTGGDGGFMAGTFVYHDDDRTTVFTNSLGHSKTLRYDELGHVTSETDALGNTILFERDERGRVLARTDAVGGRTSLYRDSDGNVVRHTSPDAAITEFQRNEFGQIAAVRTADGGVWRREYDQAGNVLTVTDPLGAVHRFTYAENGAPTASVDPFGNAITFETDAAGLPIAATDPFGATTRVKRDLFGRVTELIDALGARSEMAWTVEGRRSWQVGPDGARSEWTFDAEGRLLTITDPTGARTVFEPGPFGRAMARTGPDGVRHSFVYDTELNLTAVVNPDGAEWHYRFDPADRLISETDFIGRTLNYRYDDAGRLIGRSTGTGTDITLDRDAAGRLVARHTSDSSFTYTYDIAGRLAAATGPNTSIRYQRDALGHVVAETVDGRTTTFAYDAMGRRTGRTTPTGAVSTWEYDAAGRPRSLQAGSGYLTLAYDAVDREVERVLGPGAWLTNDFDESGRISAQHMFVGDRQHQSQFADVALTRAWQWRDDGILAQIDDSLRGTRRFDADGAGRITAVSADTWNESYSYDAFGNLTAADAGAEDTTGAREVERTLIRSAGRTTYERDATGRLVRTIRRTLDGRRKVWQYVWDAEDRLVQTVTPEGVTWQYTYDPLSRRTGKVRLSDDGSVVERVAFTWDGPRVAEQHSLGSDNAVTAVTWDYDPGTFRPAAQRRRSWAANASQEVVDEVFHAIVTDLVGTPTELVTPDGRIAWRTTSNLWGRSTATVADPDVDCPLRFPGQYYDSETGLHYNLHRYYDPDTASYLTPDPLGLAAAPNDHAYVPNPLVFMDPLGLACDQGQRVYQKAVDEADRAANELSSSQRPAVSEAIQVGTGANARFYTSLSGQSQELAPEVQAVLDRVPVEERGVGHGRCGLPSCLTQAINDGVDPTGAKVAAVLIKNDPEKWDHGVPIGPCDSCKHLVDHFDLDFVE